MTQEQPRQNRWRRLIRWTVRLVFWYIQLIIAIQLFENLEEPFNLLGVVPFLVLIAVEMLFVQRRHVRQVRALESEYRLAIRRGPMERMYRSALDLRERADSKTVERAVALCDAGDFESAVELMDDALADTVISDYAALYVRGFAHFNLGARRQAHEDFQKSMKCLLSEQGIVESALAGLYLAERNWAKGQAAAVRSIEHLGLTNRTRRWVPYVYKAAIHELDGETQDAEETLMQMVCDVPASDEVKSFLEHNPFLKARLKNSPRLAGPISEWGTIS